MNVGFVSLGCSKNLVDTEMCIGLLKDKNLNIVNNPEEADMIIVNTCGFIESAKEEAINTLFEMAEYKKLGKCKYLVAIGCLVKRYKEKLEKSMPEVDLFISTDEYEHFWKKINELIKFEKNQKEIRLEYNKRVITTGKKLAYLKIAEGCSNRCTYCAIPQIRGPYVSRKMEDILEEAENLAKKGIEEVVVIAQDTTKYGIDLYGESKLAELLKKLCKIDGFKWIRFLYAYPESITDELIKVVKEEEKICKYFDIPIQHYSDKVLKRMNRKSDGKSIENLLNKIRKEIPNVVLRTSLIVGFPGETEEDFFELYEFVHRVKFDKLGVFTYSKEDNTPAAKLKDQIHHMTKKSRRNKIMELQQHISKIKLEELIGNNYEAIIESVTEDGKYYIGRTYMDVPDEDGVVFIKREKNEKDDLIDKFVIIKVIDVLNYDLIGEIV